MVTDELDVLLERLGRVRFVLHQFRGDHHGPEILAAVHDWREVADVVVLRDESDATAWRTPTGDGVDVFNPTQVLWTYKHNAVWTLRALLTLPQPGYPDAPTTLLDVHRIGLPAAGRMPVRIRMRKH
jgi:hypothetical protein